MIRVALCDDDIIELNKMQVFLNRYCRERGLEIDQTAFCSPVELLENVCGGG